MKITDLINNSLTDRLDLIAGDSSVWVEFKSVKSPEFIEAQNSFNQSMASLAAKGEELISKSIVLGVPVTKHSENFKKLMAIMFASIITSWSFDDEVTLESAATFLYNNQDVLNEIDKKSSALTLKENAERKKLLNLQ